MGVGRLNVFVSVLWAKAPIRFCLKKNTKRRIFYHCCCRLVLVCLNVESSMDQSMCFFLSVFQTDVFRVGVWPDPSWLENPKLSNLTPDLMELQLSSLLPQFQSIWLEAGGSSRSRPSLRRLR